MKVIIWMLDHLEKFTKTTIASKIGYGLLFLWVLLGGGWSYYWRFAHPEKTETQLMLDWQSYLPALPIVPIILFILIVDFAEKWDRKNKNGQNH